MTRAGVEPVGLAAKQGALTSRTPPATENSAIVNNTRHREQWMILMLSRAAVTGALALSFNLLFWVERVLRVYLGTLWCENLSEYRLNGRSIPCIRRQTKIKGIVIITSWKITISGLSQVFPLHNAKPLTLQKNWPVAVCCFNIWTKFYVSSSSYVKLLLQWVIIFEGLRYDC